MSKGTKNHMMYCQVCGKPFNVRDAVQVNYHELECEPSVVYLPEDAHYARLEDDLPSVMPQELLLRHLEPITLDQAVQLIHKVTSSL